MKIILCQALDGRWHFGPEMLRAALESDEHGVFNTKAEAKAAAESTGAEVEE